MRAALGTWADDDLRARIGDVEFVAIRPISRAFAPMVREEAFDISEMAIATFLMAKAQFKPLVLLPVAVFSRYQEPALLCRRDDVTISAPADLVGRRVGIRAYSQTTGMWLRGVLREDFKISADDIHWVTFEDAHVAGYRDPPFAERASPGSDLAAMLRNRELDAIIVGGDMPSGEDFRTVFPDPVAAARQFHAAHGFEPVNHLLVVRKALLAEQQDSIRTLLRVTSEGRPHGHPALDEAVSTAARYCYEQGLTSRVLTLDEIWEGLPENLSCPEV